MPELDSATHLIVFAFIVAFLLRVVVEAMKRGPLKPVWIKIPRWIRPYVVVLIGGALGGLDALATGQDKKTALLTAISGAALAMASHESGKRKDASQEKKEL